MFLNNDNDPKVYTEQQVQEELEKGNKKSLVVIVIMVILMIGLVLVYYCIANDVFSVGTSPNTTTHPGFKTTTTSTVSSILITTRSTSTTSMETTTTTTTKQLQTSDVIHKLKIRDMQRGETKEFTLAPGKVVKVKMKKVDGQKVEFDLTYNDKKVVSEKLSSKDDIEVILFGQSLIYINTEEGSQNYKKIFIMRENKRKEEYEFDTIKGMNPDEISIQGNKFIIKCSRITKDKMVKFGTAAGMKLCDPNTWTLGFTYSSIVEATYTYTLTNGSLSTKPIYSNPVTLQQSLDRTGVCN